MFKETVEVIEVWGDKAKIKFTKKENCSCCKASHVCGMGKEKLTINSYNFNLKVGDKIEVGIEEKKTLLASLVMFLIPGTLFMLSLMIFRQRGEALSFLLALLILCTYYITVKFLLKNHGKKFHLKILKKI